MNQSMEKKFDREINIQEMYDECYQHYFNLVRECRMKNLYKGNRR